MRDATASWYIVPPVIGISIHASHAGRDKVPNFRDAYEAKFQSTRPMRDATTTYQVNKGYYKFQSTRPMRDATYCAF